MRHKPRFSCNHFQIFVYVLHFCMQSARGQIAKTLNVHGWNSVVRVVVGWYLPACAALVVEAAADSGGGEQFVRGDGSHESWVVTEIIMQGPGLAQLCRVTVFHLSRCLIQTYSCAAACLLVQHGEVAMQPIS